MNNVIPKFHAHSQHVPNAAADDDNYCGFCFTGSLSGALQVRPNPQMSSK